MSDKKELQDMVREAIDDAMSEKEEATRRAKIEEVLETAQNTIDELNKVVEEKDTLLAEAAEEKDSLSQRVEQLLAEAKELQDNLAKAEEDRKEVEDRANVAEASLAEIAKDRKLEERMVELAEAKVVKSAEEKLEIQKARVREMGDEEFASYKEELVDLRSSLEEELKAAASKEDDEDDNGGLTVAPADIGKARQETAGAGLPDAEAVASSQLDVYKKLGAAMAAKMSDQAR